MFENIKHINWEDFERVQEGNVDIPAAIKGLISTDLDVQESSYWNLENHIVLQSDLYEVAYYVIPFLIEILKSNVSSGKNHVYDLLFEITNGYASETVLCKYKGEKISLMNACRDLISEETDLYLSEVCDPCSNCRTNALDLLLLLENQKAEVLPVLRKISQKEKSTEFGSLVAKYLSEEF